MQNIAAEINLSETAFLYPDGPNYHLRWFTPEAEVSLCGHATLASAFTLWNEYVKKDDVLSFKTLSGILTARRCENLIELNFPVEEVTACDFPSELVSALGCKPIFTGRTAIRYFAEIESDSELIQLKPDIHGISKIHPGRIAITAKSRNPAYDFISRYFAPGIGIPEDPVTGSVHCVLAGYWAEKLGKNEFKAYQVSKRGGEMKVKLEGSRVLLLGSAVKVMKAQLMLHDS